MAKPGAKTSIPEGFDPVPHLRYKLHLQAALGLPLLAVYDALRSTIWRQDSYGPEVLRAHVAKGYLASEATQAALAITTGLGRSRISGHLQKLESLGWIVAVPQRSRKTAKVYELGIRKPDGNHWVEISYADTIQRGWYESINAAAVHLHGMPYRNLELADQLSAVREFLDGLTPASGAVDVPDENTKSTETTSESSSESRDFEGLAASKVACEEALLDFDVPVGNNKMFPLGTPTFVNTSPNLVESQAVFNTAKNYIDSLHRQTLTTFGSTLRTSYSESSLHSVRVGASAVASDSDPSGSSLRSLPDSSSPSTPAFGLPSDAPSLRSVPQPPADPAEPYPSPVPPPPFPPRSAFAWTPETVFRGLVTAPDADTLEPEREQPKETPQMARGAISTPDPLPAPSEATNVAPSPLPGPPAGIRDTLSDLKALAEATKARSREAMEAKFQKRRTKERKAENLTSDKSYRAQKTAAQRLEGVWREEMDRMFPEVPQIAWFKREKGKVLARKEGRLVADLLDGYGGDESVVEGIIQSFIRYWADFGPMLTKQTDSVPTLGLLYACHATVAAESVRLRKRDGAIEQYETWKRDNASNPFAVPPPDLEAAYKAALAKKKSKP